MRTVKLEFNFNNCIFQITLLYSNRNKCVHITLKKYDYPISILKIVPIKSYIVKDSKYTTITFIYIRDNKKYLMLLSTNPDLNIICASVDKNFNPYKFIINIFGEAIWFSKNIMYIYNTSNSKFEICQN